jgi:shikimate dehydrogenase
LELNISGKTKLAALLGNPVAHSVSPKMHNLAFSKLGIDCAYLAFPVLDANLSQAITAMRALNVLGFNVTMPHKQSVMKYLDEISKEAQLIGAVNTVKNENGHLTGYNTDGMGFVKSLEDEGVSYKGKKITICGAGGAGRSVSVALAASGAGELAVFDVIENSAQNLAQTINENFPSGAKAYLYSENALAREIANSAVLINCTGLGMHPDTDKSIVTNSGILTGSLVVADIIYDPSPTKLLTLAQNNGLKTVNGLAMVYNQGALAFKIWTGEDMPLGYVLENMKGVSAK